MRRVASPLAPICRHDGKPPGIGRELATRSFVRADQAWGHVGDPVDIFDIEGPFGGFRVPQDVVVLFRPAVTRPAAVVVGPDDLVQEPLGPEQLVEQEPGVVGGVKIEVEVDRSCRSQHSVDLGEALVQERQVLREGHVVSVAVARDHFELVHAVGKTLASLGTGTSANGAQGTHLLRPEGGVDVNEVDASVRQLAQDPQVVVEEDAFQRPGAALGGSQRGRHWDKG